MDRQVEAQQGFSRVERRDHRREIAWVRLEEGRGGEEAIQVGIRSGGWSVCLSVWGKRGFKRDTDRLGPPD